MQRNRNVSFRLALALSLAILFMASPALLPAQNLGDTHWVNITPEDRLFTKTLEVKGGTIDIEGGLMAGPVVQSFKDMFSKAHMDNPGPFKIASGIGVRVANNSPGRVWVVVEVKDPAGEEKPWTADWDFKPGYAAWRLWQPKKLQSNVAYPVMVTAYSDKEHSSTLATLTASWIFQEDDRKRLEDAQKTADQALRRGSLLGVLICGWPEKASPQQIEAANKAREEKKAPPFEWKEEENSPGVTLTAVERRRFSKQGNTFVEYDLRAAGFAPAEGLTLWTRWVDNTYWHMSDISLDETGLLKATYQGKAVAFQSTVGGMAPGEPIRWALASADKRAYARAVVSPIESRSEEGCSGSAEVQSASGLLFLVAFRGFAPGEDLEIRNEIGKDKKTVSQRANGKGEAAFPVLFSEGDHGKAKSTATGKDCKVTVEYKVGPDAHNPR